MDINFRAHHFLCALCFQGRGYSPAFILNFQSIMHILNSINGDKTPIKITNQTDSICEPCPHRIEHTCSSENKIKQLDEAHSSVLGIKSGQTITWGEAKKRIVENLTLNQFHRICNTCSWKESGICEGVLKRILKS